MASKPKWLSDLESQADGVAYGEVNFSVNRVNRRTTKVVRSQVETLRYRDNAEALSDIMGFLNTLVDDGHTGTVQFEIVLKDGEINILAVKNTGEENY